MIRPLPPERLRDERSNGEAERRSDGERGGEDPLGDAEPLRRELLADDCEGERQDRHANPLDRAHGNQHVQRIGPREPEERRNFRGESGDRRGDRVDPEDDHHHPLLAVDVAQARNERRRNDTDQEVGGENPRHGRDRRAAEEHDKRRDRGDNHHLDVHYHERENREAQEDAELARGHLRDLGGRGHG